MKQLIIFLFSILTIKSSLAQETRNHSVFFSSAKFEISKEEKEKIIQFIKSVDSTNEISISINSYCDDRGSLEYNQHLSEQRTQSVKNYLVENNFNSNSIAEERSNGEVQLDFANNNLDEQRKQNRRTDLVFNFKSKEKPIESSIEKELFSDTMKVGDKFTLDNILFEGGRTLLLEESFPALNNLVSTLKNKPQYSVCILGHICCVHDGFDGWDHDTGKKNLSEARARTIYKYLISNGISESRLSYKGMKGDFPTGLGDKYDRRVELEITKVDAK